MWLIFIWEQNMFVIYERSLHNQVSSYLFFQSRNILHKFENVNCCQKNPACDIIPKFVRKGLTLCSALCLFLSVVKTRKGAFVWPNKQKVFSHNKRKNVWIISACQLHIIIVAAGLWKLFVVVVRTAFEVKKYFLLKFYRMCQELWPT